MSCILYSQLTPMRAYNLPGLRSWPVKPYPYLVFYMMARRQVDVWRVLHLRRDIPAWMRT